MAFSRSVGQQPPPHFPADGAQGGGGAGGQARGLHRVRWPPHAGLRGPGAVQGRPRPGGAPAGLPPRPNCGGGWAGPFCSRGRGPGVPNRWVHTAGFFCPQTCCSAARAGRRRRAASSQRPRSPGQGCIGDGHPLLGSARPRGNRYTFFHAFRTGAKELISSPKIAISIWQVKPGPPYNIPRRSWHFGCPD